MIKLLKNIVINILNSKLKLINEKESIKFNFIKKEKKNNLKKNILSLREE